MKLLLRTAAAFGILGVALGAFGVHALRGKISEEMIAVWRTGTEYHLIHAIMATLCGFLSSWVDSKAVRTAGWLFIFGIVLFSGSLYTLALTGIKSLGAIAPLGGLSFMAGWTFLAISAKEIPSQPS